MPEMPEADNCPRNVSSVDITTCQAPSCLVHSHLKIVGLWTLAIIATNSPPSTQGVIHPSLQKQSRLDKILLRIRVLEV